MQGLHPLDYIVVIGYFAIIVFMGFFFGMFIRQARDYFAAGSGVPPWLAGISLWMASFSAMTFVIYGQLSYRYGFLGVTICWVVLPAMFAAATFLAPRWRRARIITPLGFVEERYNANIRQLFVWTGIPLRTLDNALRIFSTAGFITFVVNRGWFPLETCIIVVGIIMILYTLLGGQWAIIVTDFFQMFVLMVPVIILVPLALREVGGFGVFVAKASAVQEGFFRPLTAGHGSYGLFDFLMYAAVSLISYNSSWGLVQKYNCVASEKDARIMAIIMGVLFFITPIIFFIPTMVARVVMPELMDVPGGARQAYAAICMRCLPVGTMGLMIAGMFAATLSTLGNEYNVLSGVLSKDFYARVMNPRATDKQILSSGKINTILVGTLTMVFAIVINHIKVGNLFDIMNKVFGALGPAIYLPLIGGLFLRWMNSRGALAGILSGIASGLTLIILNIVLKNTFADQAAANSTVSYWLNQGYNSMSIVINISVTLVAMWVGSSLGRVSAAEEERAAAFMDRMEVESIPPTRQKGKERTALMTVGLALMLFGVLFLPIGFMVGGQAMAINTITGFVLMGAGLVFVVMNAGGQRERRAAPARAGMPGAHPRPRPRPGQGYPQHSRPDAHHRNQPRPPARPGVHSQPGTRPMPPSPSRPRPNPYQPQQTRPAPGPAQHPQPRPQAPVRPQPQPRPNPYESPRPRPRRPGTSPYRPDR